jgi:hypothetical protein
MFAQIVPIVTALAAVLPFLIPIGQFLYAALGQRFLPSSQGNRVQGIVNTVVSGIEQGMQNSAGPDKKAAAVTAVNGILAHYKIKVPAAFVDMLIEEAVLLINHQGMGISQGVSSAEAPGFLPAPDPNVAQVPVPALHTFFQPVGTVTQPVTYIPLS